MRIAAAYIRVSTEDQLEFSPDSQLKMLKEYARSHEFRLDERFIFSDEGISGRSAEKRPAFMRMIAAAKSRPRPFDVILVWKFSRFARNRQDSIFYKSMLRRECGVEIISITEPLADDPTSILIEALLEAMDEYYSLNLAQEVRRGMAEKFSRGGVISIPPLGYTAENGRFVPDDAAETVRYIYSSFLSGAAPGQIARALNAMGLRTRRGNPFESRSVEYILTNPTYTGKLRCAGPQHEPRDRCYRGPGVVVVEGSHTPIIPPETFEKVQQLLKHPHPAGCRSARGGYMLRGLVRCSACGATLTRTAGGSALQCCRYARGQCERSHYVSLRKMNAAVLDRLQADLGEQVIRIAPAAPAPPGSDAMLNRARRSLERARAAYAAGIDTLEQYRESRELLSREITRLSGHTHPGDAKPLDIPARQFFFALHSPEIDEDFKNRILRSIIAEIIFFCPQREFEIHYHIR